MPNWLTMALPSVLRMAAGELKYPCCRA